MAGIQRTPGRIVAGQTWVRDYQPSGKKISTSPSRIHLSRTVIDTLDGQARYMYKALDGSIGKARVPWSIFSAWISETKATVAAVPIGPVSDAPVTEVAPPDSQALDKALARAHEAEFRLLDIAGMFTAHGVAWDSTRNDILNVAEFFAEVDRQEAALKKFERSFNDFIGSFGSLAGMISEQGNRYRKGHNMNGHFDNVANKIRDIQQISKQARHDLKRVLDKEPSCH